MPKTVDHDRRRRELVEVAWRVVARAGLTGMTLLDVAKEAGYSNGAIKPYFPTKDDLVRATYSYVFERTNARVEAACARLSGLDALRAFALEVLPLDETRRDEARVVVPFWQLAIHDPLKSEVNNSAMLEWRNSIRRWLFEAQQSGRIPPATSINGTTEQLLNYLLGAQVGAILDSDFNQPNHLEDQLDSFLDQIRKK